MTKTVEFYFDVGSPAAYISWTQVPGIAREAGATIAYKPFLLGGVFQATGNRSPMEVPAKARYMTADLGRHAARHRVPYRHNPHFPINTLALMRMATGMQMRDESRMVSLVDALYQAIWAGEKNMNDPSVVTAVLQEAGFDAAALSAMAADPEVKEKLKAVTQDAVQRGVFGAPTFFVGDHMYWGQDRLDFVKEALA